MSSASNVLPRSKTDFRAFDSTDIDGHVQGAFFSCPHCGEGFIICLDVTEATYSVEDTDDPSDQLSSAAPATAAAVLKRAMQH